MIPRRRPSPPVTLPGDTDRLRDEVARLRALVAEMRGSYFVVDDPAGPYVKSAVGMSVWQRWSRVAGDGSEGEA
jgi:hypothetical protein